MVANNSIVGSCVAGCSVTLLCYGVFIIIRRMFLRHYMPLCSRHNRASWAPTESYGGIQWIWTTIRYPEGKLLNAPGGVDAAKYLRFLKYTTYFFGILTLAGFISMGVNYTGTNKDREGSEKATGLDVISFANMEPGTSIMWFHMTSVYVFSIIAYFYMFFSYKAFVTLNNQKRQMAEFQSRTIFVKKLHSYLDSDEKLFEYFSSFWGSKVESAVLMRDHRYLNSLLKRRQNKVKEYHRLMDMINEGFQVENFKLKVQVENPKWWNIFQRPRRMDVTSIRTEISELGHLITREKKKPEPPSINMGFVTFTSTSAAMQCVQALHCSDPLKMVVSLAPDSRGIRWDDCAVGTWERRSRAIVVFMLVLTLFLFWSVPVALISAFTNIETLNSMKGFRTFWKFLRYFGPEISESISSFLPSLTLNIFMALLPYILKAIFGLGIWELSRTKDSVLMRTYWLFLLLNVFLLYSVTGSLFSAIDEILAFLTDPSGLVNRLANSLPQQAIFFTNYIIIQGLVVYPVIHLVRVPDIVIALFRRSTAKTKRDVKEAYKPAPFDYAVQYARDIIVLTIGLTFSSMAPIILPFTLIYFGMAYITCKYNMVFVFDPPCESFQNNHHVLDQMFVAILIYQSTFLGVLTLKLFSPALALSPLILMTLGWWKYLRRKFVKPTEYLALENCTKISQVEFNLKPENSSSANGMYLHPALKPLEDIDAPSSQTEVEMCTFESDFDATFTQTFQEKYNNV
eukprot:TRINITY_DN4901_c0_g1_i1.p1 TRINITY_DN4901_c0_g1~~TRINITY_DN4901_c0_g1_i1.p1  ORF type:complete len:740 (-),score=218.39 TRINITY_DN4901_c0_g1_i1:4-2223(-)